MIRPFLIYFFILTFAGSVFAQSSMAPKTPTSDSSNNDISTPEKVHNLMKTGRSAPKKKRKKKQPAKEENNDVIKDAYLKTNQVTVDAVKSVSNKIDMLLTGEKTTNEKTKSSLTIRNIGYWSEGSSTITYKPRFDLRLHLPNLQEKWSVNFTSYDDDQEEVGIRRNRLQTQAPPESYGANVVLLKKLGNVDVTFRPKLQLRDKRVTTAHLLRFQSEADMKTYKIIPRLELFARADTGTGELAAINFEYEFNEKFTATLTNEEEYVDLNNAFNTNHEIGLLHAVNDTQSLKYAVLFESNDKPNFHLEQFTTYVSFRHSMYKNKLAYSLSPRLVFPRSYDYKNRLAFAAEIDFIF